MRIFILLFFSAIFTSLNAISITKAYPGAFSTDPKIDVSAVEIHGVSGYKINPFTGSESKRNHYDSRKGAKIDYLIMHFTAENFTHTVELFTDPTTEVSSHYVITQKANNNLVGGEVLQVVSEDMRSWHAGVSDWGSDSNLNYVSIGIEHVNLGFHGNASSPVYYPYDADQMKVSGKISKKIVQQYSIPPHHVLGHEDIAPPRKLDPGPLFPWKKYYQDFGVGAWLDDDEMTKEEIIKKYDPWRPYPAKPDRDLLMEILLSYGFSREGSTANDKFAISAFKKHFSCNQNPEHCDNTVREKDMFWAWALEAKYMGSGCVDIETNCQKNVTECKNSLYKPIMCKYCRKTCNLCNDAVCN